MANQFDKAQELDAMAVQAALANQQRKAARAPKLEPLGYCLNPACGEEFEGQPQRLFCNPACGAEHARRVK